MSQFRIALVQPLTSPPQEDEENVAAAVAAIAFATAQSADFVCSPKGTADNLTGMADPDGHTPAPRQAAE